MPVMDKNIKSWSHQPKLQKSLYFLIFHKARLAFQEFCLYLQTNQQRGTAYGKIHQPFYRYVGFKRIFGQEISKPLILDFLNSLLTGEEHRCRFPFQTRAVEFDVGLKKYRDTLSVLEGAKQDGLAEGRAKGLEEGRAEGRTEGIQSEKAETAKRLLAIGMDINTVAIATGLSAKDIETIINL